MKQSTCISISSPNVSEDGILINRNALDRFSFKTYDPRVVELGNKRFPLDLYDTTAIEEGNQS